jgi:cystathionine beta-lyase/cystathionine gamma-synthase
VVAELEHAEAAMVTASGMAALTTAVLALVSAGDHVIGQKSTYGGTASVLLAMADNTFATPANQRPVPAWRPTRSTPWRTAR